MQLIATIMKGPTSDQRFQDAKKLLDYGFANFSLYEPDTSDITEIRVTGGICDSVKIGCASNSILLAKGKEKQTVSEIVLEQKLSAPVKEGQNVGYVSYTVDGTEVSRVPIVTLESVKRIGFGDIFKRMFTKSVAIG